MQSGMDEISALREAGCYSWIVSRACVKGRLTALSRLGLLFTSSGRGYPVFSLSQSLCKERPMRPYVGTKAE
jgi:hypothetical protein